MGAGSPPGGNDAGEAERGLGPRLLQAAIEQSPAGILVTDATGRIEYVNPAFERITGWTRDEVVGRSPRLLKSGLHDAAFYQAMWQTITAGSIWRGELVNRRKDGSLYHEELAITPIRAESGAITHFLGVKLDVTARRAAEDALRRSERRYRALAEAARDLIFIVAPSGRVEYVNEAGAARLGRSPAEVVGRQLDELFPGESGARARASIEAALAAAEPRYEELPLSILGEEAWLGVWLARLDKETLDAGAVMGVARDITRQMRAQEALRASEERYRQQVERAPEGIFIQADGRFRSANPATAAMLGAASPAALVGKPLLDVVHPGARPAVEAAMAQVLAGERLAPMESRFVRLDGSVLEVELAAIPFDDAGGASVQVFVRDVSERKQLEAQLRQAQKMEAVGQLAGGIAHDFNNLIGVITGYGDLLARELPADHPGARRLAQIRQAADRAAALTRQLLAFSRRQVLEPKTLDLNALVKEMTAMLQRVIGEDVELARVLDPGLGRVRADRGQVEQMVLNLVVNSRDAMPRGGGLVISTRDVDLDDAFAAAHPGSRPGPHVRLSVTDTGHGMDEETMRHIFEPFFTTKPVGKGTGLGLATVYGIVKQSGGYVGVTSAPGQGAIFEVYLPRIAAETQEQGAARPEAAASPALPPPAGEPVNPRTILLIEDEKALNAIIREILEEAGYGLLACGDPEEALAALASGDHAIDLVLTDVVMPSMDGPALVERIRARQPHVEVLYMSGYSDEALGSRGSLAPGTHLIAKPFTADELLRRVRGLLSGPSQG